MSDAHNAVEKYKELYKFSNDLLKEEHGRFNRADEKATRYLSVVTFLVGIGGVCGKGLLSGLIPPKTFLEWLLLNFAVLLFFMLVGTWFVIFRALRLHKLESPPLNQEMIDFFNDQTEINIYYHIAKANSAAWEVNRRLTDKKSKALFYGYRMIIGTVCLFAVFICLFFVNTWNIQNMPTEKQAGQQAPTSNTESNKQAPTSQPTNAPQQSPPTKPSASVKPDKDASAPTYVFLANEGLPKE